MREQRYYYYHLCGFARAIVRRSGSLARASLVPGVAVAIAACNPDVAPEPPRAAFVEITPRQASISAIGDVAEFRAVVRDQYGAPFDGPVVWSGDADDVFTIDARGVATGVGFGEGTVWATVGAATASAVVRVAGAAGGADGHGGVCDRTPQVRDAILAALEMAECGAVTDEQLATIAFLDVSGPRVLSSRSVGACDRREKKRNPTPEEIIWMEHYECDGSSVFDEAAAMNGSFGASGTADSAQPGPLDPVVTLKANDFAGLSGLAHLFLHRNHLVALPEGVFDGLDALEQLWLFYNRITALPEGVFDGLASLRRLYLHGNRLVGLPDGVFDGLSSLERVYLTSNRIAALPEGAFDDLGNLRWLYMSGNRITEIPEGAFDNLGNLQRLYMGNNRITEIPEGAFDNLSSLQRLFVYGNEIEEVPSGAFDNLGELEWLYLYLNEIETLPEGVFDNLSNLAVLDLDGNKMTSLDEGVFDNLSELHTLWINRNDIRSLNADVFGNLAGLRLLYMNSNRLTVLPDGLFEGLGRLRTLIAADNPGAPFPLELELRRTDSEDPLARGTATVSIRVAVGAPFPMAIGIGTSGASASSGWVRIGTGETQSSSIYATTPIGSGFSASLRTANVPEAPECTPAGCIVGFKIVAGDPLVLANPRQVAVSTPVAYLNQAAQNRQGTVPLIAGRRAILRVFGISNDVNNFTPAGKAMFYRDGEMVHSVDLDAPPNGIPTEVDESLLTRSFNAMVPGEVLMPGTEMVVELDSEGALPLAPGSIVRVPATGAMPLQVLEVPPLNVTVVPVQYAWEHNAVSNDGVLDVSEDLVENLPEAILYPTRTVLPVRDLRLKLREPYYTWADTMESAGFTLLGEVELLRHLEAAGTAEYYHGLFAWPRYSTWQSWGFGGVAADIPSFSALTLSHRGNGSVYSGLASTFAHELGHNLALRHAPCGNAGGPDPNYPYEAAGIGVWGYDFGMTGQQGTLLDPTSFKDHMSYCGPEWVSDFSFAKSLVHRARFGWADPRTRRGGPQRTLMLSGSVHDGTLRLGPTFVWQAQSKMPARGGSYTLTGFDASGRQLFSLSFEPGAPNDLGGRSFVFAVPYRPEWDQRLEQIVLRGPEGFVAVDRPAIDQVAVFADRDSGRIRSIASRSTGDVPAAMGRSDQFRVSRGLQGPRRR